MATLPLIAGIISPALLTVGLFIWQDRWKKDALSLNSLKCGVASLFFAAIVASLSAQSSTSKYSTQILGYMMLSSFLGIIIADTWWLIALERIGARRMITIDAVKPFLALAFGSFVLQDKITSLAIIGITFTSLGVLLVNLEKRSESGSEDALTEDEITHSQVINRLHDSVHSTNSTIDNFELTEPHSGLDATNAPVVSEGFDVVAYLYAFGNVVLDVYSATLIVKWHGALSSADVNLVRFGFATVVLVSVLGIKRQQFQVFNFIFYSKQTESPPSPMSAIDWVAVVCGIVFVTVLTPLINTWVLFKLKLAIAITLNSTSPLWSLPVAYFHHEVISVKAILGAVLATGGIVLLILG